jgi:hypothetical protein
MDGEQGRAYKRDQIEDAFRKSTSETRLHLENATDNNASLTYLITSHAEALKKALTFLATKIYRHNRPSDAADLRRFMRDEIDAIWYIHEIMDDDIMLIRSLEPPLEASIPSVVKEEWRNTLNQVDLSINASLNVVRAALDGWDVDKTSDQRSTGRQLAIDTLTEVAKQWTAIATTLTSIRSKFPDEASSSRAAAMKAPEDYAGPGHRSATG